MPVGTDVVDALDKQGFVVEKTLGKGSYSRVVGAKVKKTEEKRAIKIIDKKKASERYRTLFLPREIAIIKRIKHPNVIKTYTVLEMLPSITFIVTEVASRGDLEQLVSLHGHLKEEKSREICRDIFAGLAYLHFSGIAHRDIKCENILLGADWTAKLGDFGFARDVKGNVMSQTYCGSAAYAAPEVIAHKPYLPLKADMWSVGVVLFIMLTGLMPFDETNLAKMLKEQKAAKLRFPSSISLSAGAVELVKKLMNPNPTTRITAPEAQKATWTMQKPRPAAATTPTAA